MSAEPTDAELELEVQGLPLTGYGAPYSLMRNLVLSITDPGDARRFLRELHASPWLDFGGKNTGWPDHAGVNIGFTCEGLRLLGAPARLLAMLRAKSPAFSDGAPVRAAHYLGDAGASAVERWNSVFQQHNAHVWITINSDDMLALEHATNCLRNLAGASTGLAGWQGPGAVPDGEQLCDPQDSKTRFVHFGFRDNLTRPSIFGDDGKLPRPGAVHQAVRPGELLLGYPNRTNTNVWAPEGTARDLEAFVRNGTFGVLRQIEQDEASFDDFLDLQVKELTRQGYAFATRDYLKAKLCGRWPGGAPIQPEETEQPPGWTPGLREVDFSNDKDGLGCPFGAHIRRANPRDDPLMPALVRTLFRRSIPYGPRYPGKRDDVERGLVGVFFCGRIEDQFELLVSEWLEKNPLGPRNRGRAKDPLSGHHDEPEAAFHIPMNGGSGIVLKGLQPFVRTRGTLYALFPSRRALGSIATSAWGRTS